MYNEFNSFLVALASYSWWQVGLQLLLIGTPLYFIVRYLQGTRAARMLKAAAFLLIAPYLILRVVGRDELAPIEFLYGRFLIFVSLALLVVFAPELRRVLMRLGETRFFLGQKDEMLGHIQTLVQSAVYLSKRRIGALVAIERVSSLSHVADNGTRIDAVLSAELLNTIFYPNSPLHDLGVIVGRGRILYAGVQFPLAESGELERELGSRHRAAVGLSADSDAVVMVISEQTGDISIAERGQLYRKLTPEGLEGLLVELVGGDSQDMQQSHWLTKWVKPKRTKAVAEQPRVLDEADVESESEEAVGNKKLQAGAGGKSRELRPVKVGQ